jgi:hypothetical protein
MTTNTPVSQGDRRRFVVLLSVLGVVAAVFFGRMLLGGGGGDDHASNTSNERLATQAASRSEAPGAGQSIAVLDVFNDASGTPQARVRVGSTVYTVGVGDTFATSYKVVSLNEPCGQFLFGDSSFQLCEGEETIK